MPFRYIFVAAALLGLFGCAKAPDENVLEEFAKAAQDAGDSAPSPIALEAKLNRTTGGAALSFRLQNVSTDSIELYPFELPWGNSNSLDIAAIGIDGVTMNNSYPIDDPILEDLVKLAPGATLSGEYDLNNRIDVNSLPARNVLVLWSYRLRHRDGRLQSRLSGVVSIPAGTVQAPPKKSLERTRER